ncbi:MAG: MerR family transcriptional regulator, partial [Turicibacter sp.]
EKTNLSTHTIRFYEKEGLLPSVHRNELGNRSFTDTDLEWLSLIDCFKNTGMHLKEIKHYIDLYNEGPQTFEARKDILFAHREAVLAQQRALEKNLIKINSKIEYYQNNTEIHSELKKS